MIHHVYSIYDQKAKAFLPPFMLPREEMAIRTFKDCCNSKDHQFGRHPEDYTMFRLANFDDESGTYNLEPAPITVYNGLQLLDTPEMKGNGKIGNDTPVLTGTESGDTAE